MHPSRSAIILDGLRVLARGLRQTPYCLEAVAGGTTVGLLPLMDVRSVLFGRFLTSLPYLNYGGVIAEDSTIARQLIDRAVGLSDELDVRFLELRHECPCEHDRRVTRSGSKVHMRLCLPATPGQLWDQLSAKVRNQVRKGTKSELTVNWGGEERLGEFYDIFSQNMRDLGTPVFSRRLFVEIIASFLIGRSSVSSAPVPLPLPRPSCSTGRGPPRSRAPAPCDSIIILALTCSCTGICLSGQSNGARLSSISAAPAPRATPIDSSSSGAPPRSAEWQLCPPRHASDMRPDNPHYERMIRIWKRLPIGLTRRIGPMIVRGIP